MVAPATRRCGLSRVVLPAPRNVAPRRAGAAPVAHTREPRPAVRPATGAGGPRSVRRSGPAVFIDSGNEQLVASRPSSWRPLESLERIDDHTVRLTFSQSYPSVLNILGTEARRYHEVPFLPSHFLTQFHIDHNAAAGDLAKAEGHESWAQLFLSKWPVDVQQRMDPAIPTIDPWTMVKLDELGNKFFERNPYYWKVDPAGNQLPYIDTQDRLLHENLEAVTSKIIAGELDYALQFTTMDNFPLYKEHEERGNYRTNLWFDGRGNVMLAIRPNLNHRDPVMRELFQEIRFREALSIALDRDEINEVIWRGLATPRAATVDPTVSFYEPWMGEKFIEYDVDRANQILNELGLTWDERHEFRLRPDGDTLTIHIDYYQLEEKMEVGVELIKQFWEELGIKLATRAVDGPLIGQRLRAGELDVFIWNFDQTTEIGFHGRPTFHMPPLENALDLEHLVRVGRRAGRGATRRGGALDGSGRGVSAVPDRPRPLHGDRQGAAHRGGQQPVGHRHRRHHPQADDRQGQPAQRQGRGRTVHLLLPLLDDLSPGAVVLRVIAPRA